MTDSVAPPELSLSRFVRADHARVFAAWTDPTLVVRWWGPPHVTCTDAEIDLRVGGEFRLANRLPDGSTLWISGVYLAVDPPTRLVHTWVVGSGDDHPVEQVTVDFVERNGGTEISIRHSGIPTAELRTDHQQGWIGCLVGLVTLLE